MKVRELAEMLKKFDPEIDIWLTDGLDNRGKLDDAIEGFVTERKNKVIWFYTKGDDK